MTIDATGGGDVAIGDSTNGETQFSGLQVGTTITRRNAKGDDVSQPGDVPEPEKPAQPTVTPTEGAEAPSTGSVEVERPVTVEGLYPERHDPDHPRQRHRDLGPPDAGHGPHPEGSGREDPCVHHPALPLHHGLGGRPAGG